MYNGNMYNPYAYLNTGLQRQEVIRVNGRNGAEAYQMAPNSSILLLDETAPVIWLKTTDGASYPTITGYTISPMKEKPAVVEVQPDLEIFANLEARIKKLEDTINAKSDATKAKSKQQSDKQQ